MGFLIDSATCSPRSSVSGDEQRGQHQGYTHDTFKPCFRFYRTGKPCYRWNCCRPQCRRARLSLERKRLQLGVEQMEQQGQVVWFITISCADKHQNTDTHTAQKSFQQQISKILNNLHILAGKAEVNLLYARVSGVKSRHATSPFQLHMHLIVSWIPHPIPYPTPSHPNHYRSERLEKEVQKYGLEVWSERAVIPSAVIQYLVSNLDDLSKQEGQGKVDLPGDFNRVSYSHNWPKLDYQIRRQEQRQWDRMLKLVALLKRLHLTFDELVIAAVLRVVIGSETPTLSSLSATFSHPSISTPPSTDPSTPILVSTINPLDSQTTEVAIPTTNSAHHSVESILIGEDIMPTPLPISIICIDHDLQTRIMVNQETITEYVQDMQRGCQFPPVEVFHDGTSYWLADGFHRVQAAQEMGIDTITAIIHPGSKRDALLFAVGANTNHGLRRSNADKRRAVAILLADSEWSQWSDGVIAEQCGVSQPFVSKLRREFTQNGFEWGVRKGADGRAINTTSIGKVSPSSLLAQAPSIIQEKVASGDLAVNDAHQIAVLLEQCSPSVSAVVSRYGLRDANVIPVLERLAKHKSATFETIAATGYVQGSGEPIPLSEANVRDVEDVVAEARFHHVLEQVEQKRERQDVLVNYQVVSVLKLDGDQLLLRIPKTDLSQLKAATSAVLYLAVDKEN